MRARWEDSGEVGVGGERGGVGRKRVLESLGGEGSERPGRSEVDGESDVDG